MKLLLDKVSHPPKLIFWLKNFVTDSMNLLDD